MSAFAPRKHIVSRPPLYHQYSFYYQATPKHQNMANWLDHIVLILSSALSGVFAALIITYHDYPRTTRLQHIHFDFGSGNDELRWELINNLKLCCSGGLRVTPLVNTGDSKYL
jgi:hypothetical protein